LQSGSETHSLDFAIAVAKANQCFSDPILVKFTNRKIAGLNSKAPGESLPMRSTDATQEE